MFAPLSWANDQTKDSSHSTPPRSSPQTHFYGSRLPSTRHLSMNSLQFRILPHSLATTTNFTERAMEASSRCFHVFPTSSSLFHYSPPSFFASFPLPFKDSHPLSISSAALSVHFRNDGASCSTSAATNNSDGFNSVHGRRRRSTTIVPFVAGGPVLPESETANPLGRKEVGQCVVKWVSQGIRAMAADFVSAEIQGEFHEVRHNMESGATFVAQAQRYHNAIPMPKGMESACLKASTHYATLLDHFQRDLRDMLQCSLIPATKDWRKSESWKLLKEFANSAQHRAITRISTKPRKLHIGLGMELEKAKVIQKRIDAFVGHMSELLRIERDVELEATQEELNAVPAPPDENMDQLRPIEYLVTHGQAQQENCDTICNLSAVSSSIGLGGMHIVLFQVDGNHRLPPTTLSPGDMVCVRVCDNRGAGATSSMQGFVNSLGEDGCSISVAFESRHGDPTFSKLFGKNVRLDRIHGLADALTYERNCEALMLLQKNGLNKKNPALAVVATLFGEAEHLACLERNNMVEWGEEPNLSGILDGQYDESQLRAIFLGLNKKRPVLIIQGPPGTGKTGLLKELITSAVQRGEWVLVTAPTNAAIDNMVKKLATVGLNIVRVGNPVRISSTVASLSLGAIVNDRLAGFKEEFERKRADLRKDLRQCLKGDSLASGIHQLLKQLGKELKKKEKDTVKEVLSNAQVVLCTNTGAADPLVSRLENFDLVVIDEAGQAIEPSCWIPILRGKHTILAGDQCQLAPVVLSRKALDGGVAVSLMERASDLHGGRPTIKLMIQYRMNDAIASWASKEIPHG